MPSPPPGPGRERTEPERAAIAAIAAHLAGDDQGARQLLATADDVVPVAGCLVVMAGRLLLAGNGDPGERAKMAELLRESCGRPRPDRQPASYRMACYRAPASWVSGAADG
jgi:hypothetical protein